MLLEIRGRFRWIELEPHSVSVYMSYAYRKRQEGVLSRDSRGLTCRINPAAAARLDNLSALPLYVAGGLPDKAGNRQ